MDGKLQNDWNPPLYRIYTFALIYGVTDFGKKSIQNVIVALYFIWILCNLLQLIEQSYTLQKAEVVFLFLMFCSTYYKVYSVLILNLHLFLMIKKTLLKFIFTGVSEHSKNFKVWSFKLIAFGEFWEVFFEKYAKK